MIRKIGKIKVLFLAVLLLVAFNFETAGAETGAFSQLDNSTQSQTYVGYGTVAQLLDEGIQITCDEAHDFQFYILPNIDDTIAFQKELVLGYGYPLVGWFFPVIESPNSYDYDTETGLWTAHLAANYFTGENCPNNLFTLTAIGVQFYSHDGVSHYTLGSATDVVPGFATINEVADTQVADFFYSVDGGEEVPVVSLTYPTEASTIQDFENWILDYSMPILIQEPPFYTIFVSYGLADGDFWYSDYFFLDGGEAVDYSLQKRNVLTDEEWKAKAEIYAGETLVAVSDTVVFTIDNVYGSGTLPPEAPPVVECGPTDLVCQLTQWITSSFQTLLNYLFVPSAQSVNNFTGLLAPIENKPPIGYFNIIKNELSGLSGGTASFELAGSDEISTVFEPLKTGISFCLWFIFALWLFKRITNLEI